MTLRVYNTLSGEKEDFKPLEGKKVKMYVCGQTVYDYMHIGHGKTYIAFDIVKRYLEHRGYDVELVINITDVNEKILDRAEEEGKDYWDVAEKYARINIEDFESLGINGDVYPRASNYVQEMIEVIEDLIEKDYAYEVEGDVFFDVRKFDDYGKLSNQKLEDISGQRDDIIASQKKKHSEDFVLWRKKEDVEPNWESPWSEGWPGWHIECSTMSMKTLRETLDIHGGGVDLVFPHHEDEIAQSEASTGKKFSKYWMHSGLVRMKEEKMSKSMGNIVSTRELLEEYDPETLRLTVASSHYRKEMDFSEDKIEENRKKLEKLRNTASDLRRKIEEADVPSEKYTDKDLKTFQKITGLKSRFEDAMDDDFNTPEASKHLLELSSVLQKYMEKDPKKPVLARGLRALRELGNIFGILEEEKRETSESTQELVDILIDIRNRLREKEEYELTDEIRDRLEDIGIQLEDEGGETAWKRS